LTKSKIIVDTNIIFSALLKRQSVFTALLLESEHKFYVPELVIIELFKHKDKILKLSQIPEEDLLRFYHVILRRINIYKEDLIQIDNLKQAYNLCFDIDVNDTIYIALTLELRGKLWTGDKKLKTGLINKNFTLFFEPNEN
jgi:predicted nucleic acid-binding protein